MIDIQNYRGVEDSIEDVQPKMSIDVKDFPVTCVIAVAGKINWNSTTLIVTEHEFLFRFFSPDQSFSQSGNNFASYCDHTSSWKILYILQVL